MFIMNILGFQCLKKNISNEANMSLNSLRKEKNMLNNKGLY